MIWNTEKIRSLFKLSFMDLLYKAQTVHRRNFNPNIIQVHTLLSVKTGKCSEDCAYCPQSAHYQTGVQKQNLLSIDEVIAAAKQAKSNGAKQFSIAAQGKSPDKKVFAQIIKMIKEVKKLGLNVCATLGELSEQQIQQLEQAGLDSYNHNLDTSPEFYKQIITTHSFKDRLATLTKLSTSNIKICCGGIVGMGETVDDRINLLLQLANLPKQPYFVPINLLIRIPGTPLENTKEIDPFDFIRMIAVTRIVLSKSIIALAGGLNSMSDEMITLCFWAGANAIHSGKKLLATPLPGSDRDLALFKRLGIKHA